MRLTLHLLCSFGTHMCFKEDYLVVNVYVLALFSQVLLISPVLDQRNLSFVSVVNDPVFMSVSPRSYIVPEPQT